MIKSITLQNFQSHKDSTIEFSPGFNVIVGPSDHGKSSIIRAIDWARSNRPRGDSFIRSGQESSEVIIENNTGKVLRNRDTKSTGYYKLYIGGKAQKFSVLGNDVPDGVDEILNLTDINIQLQLDTHYLILNTPGQTAKYLNSITKLDKLTDALDSLKRKLNDNNSRIQEAQSKIDACNEYLSSGVKDILVKLETIKLKLDSLLNL